MSIDIDWDSLTTGSSGDALADSIRDFIHSKFQQVQLPRFIRSVHVHSFAFGNECPTVELKDISDPLPEFYEEDESSEEDGEEEREGDQSRVAEELGHGQDAMSRDMRPPQKINTQHQATTNAKATPPHFQTLSRTTTFPEALNTPFLSRSTTPGIPGGTSNLSYFHLPLSAGLSYAATPLGSAGVTPFSPPPQWSEHFGHPQRPSSPVRAHPPQGPMPIFDPYADPTSRPSTAYSHPSSPPFLSTDVFNAAGTAAAPLGQAELPGGGEDRSQDLQTTLHISYDGSLSLSLTAEILLDYPMPSFVGIPLKLQITGLSFDGVALLAYLRGSSSTLSSSPSAPLQQMPAAGSPTTNTEERTQNQNQIKFCFLAPNEARAVLRSAEGQGTTAASDDMNSNDNISPTIISDKRNDGGKDNGDGNGKVRFAGGLLQEIRVESEVGRQENGKQVLKNVGKIEKFVVEQMRKIFEDEFVWPGFWTFLV